MTQEQLAEIRERAGKYFPLGTLDRAIWLEIAAEDRAALLEQLQANQQRAADAWTEVAMCRAALLGTREQLEAAQAREAKLRLVLEAALEHLEDLEEAWLRGALHENDGLGGIRSNRNVECARAARAALEEK